jgi:hypothetical protein
MKQKTLSFKTFTLFRQWYLHITKRFKGLKLRSILRIGGKNWYIVEY